MKVLGVVPARGGSKRIPRKNTKLLCGKPLLCYTIRACQESERLTDWVVSTEDPEIRGLANSYGAKVLHRPPELAEDKTTSGEVMVHAMEAYADERYDAFVCLHPTSPLRTGKHIDEALTLGPNTVSVELLAAKSHRHVNAGGAWFSGAFVLNAAIYVSTPQSLYNTGSHVPTDPKFYVMDKMSSIDINEPIDFKIAELYMRELQRENS